MYRARFNGSGAALAATALLCLPAVAQDHSGHARHRMTLDETGMVMNANDSILPRDCSEISRDYTFEVRAGTKVSEDAPGRTFAYDRNEFEVEPCSRITVKFSNEDKVRHQWMLHGLPRYLYPGGMFHLEAAGGETREGTLIVPSDAATYLVHCDIAQHMEKGMKAQLKVGGGSGDLWSIPGVSGDPRLSTRLPRGGLAVLLGSLLAGFILGILIFRSGKRET